MLREFSPRFIDVFAMLGRLQQAVQHDKPGDVFSLGTANSQTPATPGALIAELRAALEELGLKFSLMKMAEMKDAIEAGKVTNQHFAFMWADLDSRVIDELKSRVLLSIEPDEAAFYCPTSPLFGNEVEARYPSASPEIAEAGKCFSLSRYSASVFHLMRVLEIGLNSLAQRFDVQFANANWQNIIDLIEKKIRLISAATHGADWKNEERFYSEIATHFRFLKNAWRNYAMHVHERYDEERAITIFNNVRDVMKHLSERLSEAKLPS
jgi:hypothetical protein